MYTLTLNNPINFKLPTGWLPLLIPPLISTLWQYFVCKQGLYFSDGFVPKKIKESKRIHSQTNYIRRKFHLEDDFIYCPISKNNYNKKKFIFDIDASDLETPIFSIISPLDESDNELRYGIFSYKPGKKESIIDGVQSWAGK